VYLEFKFYEINEALEYRFCCRFNSSAFLELTISYTFTVDKHNIATKLSTVF